MAATGVVPQSGLRPCSSAVEVHWVHHVSDIWMLHGARHADTLRPRSALYLLLIAGHVLVTLREAFAVAPGVDAARVIAVRHGGPDIYGQTILDCMVAGRWTRTAFNGVRWADADAGNILAGTATELVLNQKRGQVLPVDLSTEPEIRDILAAMDTTDPATED